MIKDFDKWNTKKKILDNSQRVFFRERDIWFASLGLNIGFEQNGKGDLFLRPVIILKKFNNEIFLGIPTTSKKKDGGYYYDFKYEKNKSTTAILSQIRLMDGKRLRYIIGYVSKIDFNNMKKQIILLLK